jgi:FeS assembly SUF system protein
MSSEDRPPLPLGVLNPNAKLEELRKQPPARAKTFADQNVIDRAVDGSKSPEQRAMEEQIIDALRQVYDPEIPVNIYDLGLIYGIEIDAENRVTITMTLTAPACPVADDIVRNVEAHVENVDAVKSATVKLVFSPPWSKDRMSEAALLELGLL